MPLVARLAARFVLMLLALFVAAESHGRPRRLPAKQPMTQQAKPKPGTLKHGFPAYRGFPAFRGFPM